jgi:hypothetical protein
MKWQKQRTVINLMSPSGNTIHWNGRTRTSKYIRGGIRCHGGVSIPCRPVVFAVHPISKLKISKIRVSKLGIRNYPLSKSVRLVKWTEKSAVKNQCPVQIMQSSMVKIRHAQTHGNTRGGTRDLFNRASTRDCSRALASERQCSL